MLTVYTRAPAEVHWSASGKDVCGEIGVNAVLTARFDKDWGHAFRHLLSERFNQGEVIIRALLMELV